MSDVVTSGNVPRYRQSVTKLHEILGKTATSPEASEVLIAYPNLRVHVEDLGPEEAGRAVWSGSDA